MSLAYHRLPARAFDVLAAGGGAGAIGLLRRSQYSKHVLLLRGIGEHAPAAYDPAENRAIERVEITVGCDEAEADCAERDGREPLQLRFGVDALG